MDNVGPNCFLYDNECYKVPNSDNPTNITSNDLCQLSVSASEIYPFFALILHSHVVFPVYYFLYSRFLLHGKERMQVD
jgi:hypothetical protein